MDQNVPDDTQFPPVSTAAGNGMAPPMPPAPETQPASTSQPPDNYADVFPVAQTPPTDSQNIKDLFPEPPKASAFKILAGAIMGNDQALRSVGTALSAGVGEAKNALGFAVPLGFSEETKDDLRKAGIYNDLVQQHFSAAKAVAEGIMAPIGVALDAMGRGVGAVIAELTGAARNLGEQTGNQFLEKGVPELSDWYQTAFGMELGKVPAAQASAVSGLLLKSRESGVVGTGETTATYFGLEDPSPETLLARDAAGKTAQPLEAPKVVQDRFEFPEHYDESTKNLLEALGRYQTDQTNEIARSLEPAVFEEYDRLALVKQDMRTQLDALRTQRDSQFSYLEKEPEQIQSEIEAVQKTLDVLDAKKTLNRDEAARHLDAQSTLETLQSELKYVNGEDTPELADVRQKLLDADVKQRDLAEKVSEAYRNAATFEPESLQDTPKNPEPSPAEQTTFDDQEKQIKALEQEKLQKAGRPADESEANASMVAAHYRALSEMGWVKESPLDAYQKYAPDVRQGRDKVQTPSAKSRLQTGWIRRIIDSPRAIITLMKRANASTFMHESAHHWLDEMLLLEKQEGAPDTLKADVKTVRNWLGAKDGEDLAPAQHEQWARGFERYLMEGVAPSRKLATVFAKFWHWLTSIYKSVKQLNSPITDDIRQVFDRLLDSLPEKIVIAGDIRPEENLSKVHVKESKSATPGNAAEVADKIRNDVDTLAKTRNKKVYDVLRNADTQAEIDAVQSERGGVTGSSTERSAGREAPPTEPSDINAGRERGKPEEPSVERTEQPSGPNGKLSRGTGPIDKAGNIRLDLFNPNVSDDILQVIRDAANLNKDFIDDRRGVVTNAMSLQLADSLGVNPSFLNYRQIGQAFNAHEILAAMKLLTQSADKVTELAQSGNLEAWYEATIKHEAIQATVAQMTAEAGRSLQVFQAIRKLPEVQKANAISEILAKNKNGPKDLNQLQSMMDDVSTLETPAQVSKYLIENRFSRWERFKKGGLFYWMNGLISGLFTHLRYTIGNEIRLLFAVADKSVSYGVNRVLRNMNLSKGDERVYWDEVLATWQGFCGQKDAWKLAWKVFQTNERPDFLHWNVSSSTERFNAAQKLLDAANPAKYDNNARILLKAQEYLAKKEAEGWKSGQLEIPPGISRSALKYLLDAKAEAQPEIAGKLPVVGVNLQDIVGLPGRSVMALHSAAYYIRYTQEINSAAVRRAYEEFKEGGDLPSLVSKYKKTPLAEDMQHADDVASLDTYIKPFDYDSFMGKFINATNSSLPLKIMVPFAQIGTRIGLAAFGYRTPLGFFSKEVRDNIFGENGARAQADQIAKMTIGMGLVSLAAGLALAGVVTGPPPTNPAKARVWYLTHRPYSINLGDVHIPYSGIAEFGPLIGATAELVQYIHDGPDGITPAIGALIEAASNTVLTQNFAEGIHNFMNALQEPETYGATYVQQLVATLVPFTSFQSQLAKNIDPYQRVVRNHGWDNFFGILDAIKARTPFLSETLEPKIDAFGNPIPSGALFSSYETDYQNDPVAIKLNQMFFGVGPVSQDIKGVRLSDAQYTQYSTLAGRSFHQLMSQTLQNMKSMSPLAQHELVMEQLRFSRRIAEAKMLALHPDIMAAAEAAKNAQLRGYKVPNQ